MSVVQPSTCHWASLDNSKSHARKFRCCRRMIARFNTLGLTVGLKGWRPTVSQCLKVTVADVHALLSSKVGQQNRATQKMGRLRKVLMPKPKVPPHKWLLIWQRCYRCPMRPLGLLRCQCRKEKTQNGVDTLHVDQVASQVLKTSLGTGQGTKKANWLWHSLPSCETFHQRLENMLAPL